MAYMIRDLPDNQRPQERLLELGAESLSDAELLAIILQAGIRRLSAIDLAQQLLAEFRGFRGLNSRSTAELCAIPGLGPAKVARLKAALAIGKKLMLERDATGEVVTTSEAAFKRVAMSIRDRSREVFLVIFLTVRNRVIKERILFEGSLTESSISIREVVKEALNESAAGVIFAHNHPSLDPTPSKDDQLLTARLLQACRLVEIRMLDHIIVGGEKYFSFADAGLLT